MARKRRSVFIASALSQGEINDRFQFLDSRFQRTGKQEEADFTVYDTSHPIEGLQPELAELRVRSLCKPVLLFAADGAARAENVRNISEMYECEPPIFTTQEDLGRALAWYSFLFPAEGVGESREFVGLLLNAMKSRD
jgi:hypothetical protein